MRFHIFHSWSRWEQYGAPEGQWQVRYCNKCGYAQTRLMYLGG